VTWSNNKVLLHHHQGFPGSLLRLGGDVILAFIHGNLSGLMFEILSPCHAVEGSNKTGIQGATAGMLSPSPEDHFVGVSDVTLPNLKPSRQRTALRCRGIQITCSSMQVIS
jgi:hypothetical protein